VAGRESHDQGPPRDGRFQRLREARDRPRADDRSPTATR
jgi:hypothetical protein